MKKAFLISSLLLAGGIGLTFATPASAAVLFKAFLGGEAGPGGNACPGPFGANVASCDVGNALNPMEEISPAIAKFDIGGTPEIDTVEFPTFDGSEITGLSNNASGSFTYNAGAGDPEIKYWAAKGGPGGFNLYWEVEDSDLSTNGGVCDISNPFTSDCLKEALAVTSGSWDLSNLPGGNPTKGPGLSNMTFFNSRGDTPPPKGVPEPAAMAGLVMVGAGIVAGRRKKVEQA